MMRVSIFLAVETVIAFTLDFSQFAGLACALQGALMIFLHIELHH